MSLHYRLRGGLSKYVAITLLVLVSVTIAVGMYAVMENYISYRNVKGLNPTIVTIEKVFKGDPTIPLLVLFVRNDGNTPAIIDTAYVVTSKGTEKISIGPYNISAGQVVKVVVPTNLSKYDVFSIKLSGRGIIATSASDLRLADLPLLEILRRSTVVITERSGSNLIDYAVNVTLTPSWGGWGHVKPDGSDIFFTDFSGKPLYYWIESFNPVSREARIWVKVPFIPAGSKVRIYMYYGYGQYVSTNPYANYGNPHKVFIFFDDMENWTGWVNMTFTGSQAGYVCQNKLLSHTGNASLLKDGGCDPSGGYKNIGTTINSPFALEAWVDRTAKTPCYWDRVGVVNANGGYGIGVDIYTPQIFIDKRSYNGVEYLPTRITYLVISTAPPQGAWYFDRLTWFPNGTIVAQLYYNGQLLGKVSATDTTYSGFTRVYVFGGYPYDVDDIRIRPYASPEPSVTVTG